MKLHCSLSFLSAARTQTGNMSTGTRKHEASYKQHGMFVAFMHIVRKVHPAGCRVLVGACGVIGFGFSFSVSLLGHSARLRSWTERTAVIFRLR